jgi:hypothetical protein
MERDEVRLDAGKFMVAVDVSDREAAGSVKVNDPAKFFGNGGGRAVGDRNGSAIANVP